MEFPNGRKAIVEQILASEDRKKVTAWDSSRKVNHLNKVV